MSRLNFSTEEKLTLENNILKEQNLQLQITGIQNERQKFINDFCSKVSKKPEQIISVDIPKGSIEFADEGKPKEAKTIIEKKPK